jgi:5-methylcytosine-specific restriction enzyme subunit McrC
LDEVSDLTREDLARDVHFTRLNERYLPAVRLAQLIIESGSLGFDVGTAEATTFLFDMNKVFEDFVTATLGRALEALGGRVAAQERHLLDVGGDVEIRPDLVWRVASRCAAVMDVKYKATTLAEVPNADVYQALAYSFALNVRPAYLISAAGNERPVSRAIRNSDLTVVTETLDLQLAPSDLLDSVDSLARRIALAAPVEMPLRVGAGAT